MTDRLQQELTRLQQRAAELEQAKEALQKSEERYRALVENLCEVVYVADEAGVITYISPAIEVLLGYCPSEVIGHHFKKFVHQDDLARLKENFRIVLSGQIAANEYRVLTKSGEICWIRTSSQPTLEGPQVVGVQGILTDISERKRVEETLHRRANELAALQETLVDIVAPHDLTILFQTIVERAVRLLNARGGGLYLCNPEKKEVRCEMSYNTPKDYRGTVLKYGEGAAGTVAETGEPLIIDDYRAWDKRAGIFDNEQPFTAILSVPMIWQDQVTGVIHILDDVESRRFTKADLELLIAFANHAAIALENARLYEETRQLAAFNEGIVKSVLVGISVEDADGDFTFLNPAAARLFGYTVDELIGQHWTAVVPPDQQAVVEQALKQRMQGEGSFYELEILRKDGTRRSILVSGSPRFEEGLNRPGIAGECFC